MSSKILMAYASRTGATAEVAEEIGRLLTIAGKTVEVMPLSQVKDCEGYQAVILGTAARMGKLLPETVKFVKKHAKDLQPLPVAYFVVCLTMKDATPENRKVVEGYLEPLRQIKPPLLEGLFAGWMDPDKLEGIWRVMMKNVEKGDYRNWDEIRQWAVKLAEVLP